MQAVAGRDRDGVRVRRLGAAEVDFAASLHSDALPHGFFASLGQHYLRAYYLTFLTSPHACALVAHIAGAPVGFVVGSLDPEAHRRYTIRRHGVRLALQGVRALVRNPRVGLDFLVTRLGRYTKGILRTFRPHLAPTTSGEHPPVRDRLGVLSHVAVLPEARGSGVGEALVDAFVNAARCAGVRRLELLTLADELGATGFYDGLGWRRRGELVDGGLHYVKFDLELE